MPIPVAQRIQRELAELERADVGIKCRPASEDQPDLCALLPSLSGHGILNLNLVHLIGTILGSDVMACLSPSQQDVMTH